MALSAIDPGSALIVVDLQQDLMGLPGVPHPLSDVVDRAGTLAAAFRRTGRPVVLVNVAGGAPGRTDGDPDPAPRPVPDPEVVAVVDALDPQPTDLRVTKATWGAFTGTALDAQLRELGIEQVVVVGIATSLGVESTARSAHEHGYHVVTVTDAMTDLAPGIHEHSVSWVFPKLGQTATVDEVLALLG